MAMTPEELTGLLARHFGALVVWTGLRDGSAEDVVQEAFVRLSGQVPTPANPAAWLYATTRHLTANHRRAEGRRDRRERQAAAREATDGTVWATAEAKELAGMLHELPDDLREVVVARTWGGLGFGEIASLVGRSKATVWREYGRALDRLRERYGVTSEPTQSGGGFDDGSARHPDR